MDTRDKAILMGLDKVAWEVGELERPNIEQPNPVTEIDTDPGDLLNFMGGIEYDDFTPDDEYGVKSSKDLIKHMSGICYDQVELERQQLSDYSPESYFSYVGTTPGGIAEDRPTHTFLIFQDDGKYYWFENSWSDQRGIHGPFDSSVDAVKEVESRLSNTIGDSVNTVKYTKPPEGLNIPEFARHILKSARPIESTSD